MMTLLPIRKARRLIRSPRGFTRFMRRYAKLHHIISRDEAMEIWWRARGKED